MPHQEYKILIRFTKQVLLIFKELYAKSVFRQKQEHSHLQTNIQKHKGKGQVHLLLFRFKSKYI